jgi:hypothetical protein
LAEDCGPGYVRHLGDDRHVDEANVRPSWHSVRLEVTAPSSTEVAAQLPREGV